MLWRALKELPIEGTHFRRQAPIGPYVVDFFCPAKLLIIELDGGHHNDDATAERDSKRQAWLEQEGYRVIRFWNSDVTGDLNAVLEQIYLEVHGALDAEPLTTETPPTTIDCHPAPPLRGDPPPPGEGKRER